CASIGLEQQAVAPHLCDFAFIDMSGHGHTTFVRRLRDPLVEKVFLGIQPGTPELRALLAKTNKTEADRTRLRDAALRQCPLSFPEMAAKLRETATANCQQAFFNGPAPADAGARAGFLTAFISETAQVIGVVSQAAGYRTVTSRVCGNRQEHELLF